MRQEIFPKAQDRFADLPSRLGSPPLLQVFDTHRSARRKEFLLTTERGLWTIDAGVPAKNPWIIQPWPGREMARTRRQGPQKGNSG